MKREIKIRCWDKVIGKMFIPTMINKEGEVRHQGIYPSNCNWGRVGNTFETWLLKDSFEVMHSTGLFSIEDFGKQKTEAYEGDIIRFATTEGRVLIKKLWWSEEYCCLMVGNFQYYRLYESAYIQPSKLQFEIIDNIYENPELLNSIT